MPVRFVKAVKVAGTEYYPGQIANFSPEIEAELIRGGYATKVVQGVQPIVDFSKVGDISEVIPRKEGEGERFSIEDLIGIPIVILSATFDKGRSGRLAGRDIAIINFVKEDGTAGWFTTWSSVLIDQVKQLIELDALPRKCMIEERETLEEGRKYYILVSATKKA